jgi:hypothetical protein
MTTDELITVIAADATPSAPFARSFRYAAGAGIAGAGLIFFVAIGPRPDLSPALETWRFLFKFLITVPLAAAAIVAVAGMAEPCKWMRDRRFALLAPLGLLAIAALSELCVLPRSLWMVRLVGSNAINCMTLIPLLSIVPLAAFLGVLRRGAAFDPGRTGAAAGLAAAAIAASFYALNCFDDSPLFVITWYPLAVSIVVAAGYLLGRRMLRW